MNSSKKQTLFQLVSCMYFLCSILLSCSVTLKERKRPLYNPYYSNTKKSSAWLPQIRLRAVSLFSWSVEQNPRDTQMTTRVTEGARQERLLPSFLMSCGFAAQGLSVRALPLLNLKKKRECLQSSPNISFNQSANCTLGFYKQFSSKVV